MDVMKKKQMLATLVMLSLLQGCVYAAEPGYVGDGIFSFQGKETVSQDGIKNKVDGSFKASDSIFGVGWYDDDERDATKYSGYSGNVSNGILNVVEGTSNTEGLIAGAASSYGLVENSQVNIEGGTLNSIIGGYGYHADVKGNIINFKNGKMVKGSWSNGGSLIVGGQSYFGSIIDNEVNIDNINCEVPSDGEYGIEIYGGFGSYYDGGNIVVKNNKINVNSGIFESITGGLAAVEKYNNQDSAAAIGNKVNIFGDTVVYRWIYGGHGINCDVIGNEINIAGNSQILLDKRISAEGEHIIGGYSSENGDAKNNIIRLAGNCTVKGRVIAGQCGNINNEISGNSINLLQQADVSDADLYGYYDATYNTYNNNLVIDKGWTGKANSVQNFNNINFNNIVWQPDNDKAILTTNSGNINGSNFNLTLQNGQKVNVGESMLLFKSNNDLGVIANDGNTFNTTLGVATAVEGIVEQSADKKMVTATIKDVKLADQTKLVAESRAVAAAFVNQGTDLIADSLDTLSRDGKYGVKTFAAVHGNRSKYDVNSDIKINGWSTIVGVGSETEHNGGDFSWGVFYENGSGNYRTFNSFNNEYFRGDGSLVYNGGGIAARYENAHGVYTEGSLRAGMLKSEMTDALSDGENKYGYSSESEYYGAHIGVGQIIPLTESSNLDVYGKFFHTYTEGDSFNVAGDEFEFDSINSDRLRVGARLTTNKENKFSTYYGLAYEYEFNSDAEMRAAGMNAPTQSLQGSSCMAEIGFNYQPTPDSPWSFDLNMRGYAGEREGATFNVQATYTF